MNETSAIVFFAKVHGGKSGVLIIGGGSPKNFVLQTEPQIQEVLGISEKGHDYYLQLTDARPDTGGLSGATPSEAVSWGKVDPDKLPGTVVAYLDNDRFKLSEGAIGQYIRTTEGQPHGSQHNLLQSHRLSSVVFVTQSLRPSMDPLITLDLTPVHDPPGLGIERVAPVQYGKIVPHQKISGFPAVA